MKLERCKETVDLEEIIDMNTDKKPTKIKATITYKSGRQETHYGKLKINGVPDRAYTTHMNAIERLSTVDKIKQERY